MKKSVVFGVVGMVVVFVSCGVLNAATLNYQGRITAGGADLSGQGYFKFALRDSGSGQRLWSNDGTVSGEPVSFLTIQVNSGLFNVELGDPSVGGMEVILPLTFHANNLELRTWFSTNTTTFEQLSPDADVKSVDFALIDTGSMLIADDDDNADFEDIQEAVTFIATNDAGYQSLLIMPGFYNVSSPLSVPTGEYVRILGMSRDWVTVQATSTAALVAFDGAVEGITFVGSPALSDVGATNYNLTVKDCLFDGYEVGPGGSAVLTGNGRITAFNSEFEDRYSNDVVSVSGEAELEATDCRFESSVRESCGSAS